ncbi:hypothetical protein L293_1560 [Acinetobacter gyllenbergii CIP 110306 = MTCC 11365]|nr:hypothetical protein L293_1560 [Acinetobacter gyllenbergii CIP 110306 = MTCC 11365]
MIGEKFVLGYSPIAAIAVGFSVHCFQIYSEILAINTPHYHNFS